jgi:hypothetical protein
MSVSPHYPLRLRDHATNVCVLWRDDVEIFLGREQMDQGHRASTVPLALLRRGEKEPSIGIRWYDVSTPVGEGHPLSLPR